MFSGELSLLRKYQDHLHERVYKYLEMLRNANWAEMTDGRMELYDGDYMNIETGMTKAVEECRWEAHRRHLDIQYVVTGAESVEWAPLLLGKVEEDRPDDDVYFYTAESIAAGATIHHQAGRFSIFIPEDLHRPLLAPQEPASIRKAVVKVSLKNLHK
ncbi:YhcH/YjgK/YiaL family protein [Negativicoccus succinicivorans]|uniref:YhcH/YjgK/YiaL family protein n=1 Tax=Negativicoccus succinicivorans TaxID=620903 RepID=UPI0028D47F2D|nr:YhcH/YjgK/YiaL family protein [Negativicoccus succinicivorans]